MNNNDLLKVFSRNLKSEMERFEENTRILSLEIDVPYSTVSNWVHGRKMPRAGGLQKLSDHYDIDVTDLTTDRSKEEKITALAEGHTYNYFPSGIKNGFYEEFGDPLNPKKDFSKIFLDVTVLGRYYHKQNLFVTRFVDNSYFFDLPLGSLVVVQSLVSLEDLRNGDIAVFEEKQGSTEFNYCRYFYNQVDETMELRCDAGIIRFSYKDKNKMDNIKIYGRVAAYVANL